MNRTNAFFLAVLLAVASAYGETRVAYSYGVERFDTLPPCTTPPDDLGIDAIISYDSLQEWEAAMVNFTLANSQPYPPFAEDFPWVVVNSSSSFGWIRVFRQTQSRPGGDWTSEPIFSAAFWNCEIAPEDLECANGDCFKRGPPNHPLPPGLDYGGGPIPEPPDYNPTTNISAAPGLNGTGLTGGGVYNINGTVYDEAGNIVQRMNYTGNTEADGSFDFNQANGGNLGLGTSPGENYTFELSAQFLGGTFADGVLYLDGTRGNTWTFNGTVGQGGTYGQNLTISPENNWTRNPGLPPPPVGSVSNGDGTPTPLPNPGTTIIPSPRAEDYATAQEYQAALNQYVQNINNAINYNISTEANIDPDDVAQGMTQAAEDAGQGLTAPQDISASLAASQAAAGTVAGMKDSLPTWTGPTVSDSLGTSGDCQISVSVPGTSIHLVVTPASVPYRSQMRVIFLWLIRCMVFLACIRDLIHQLRGEA